MERWIPESILCIMVLDYFLITVMVIMMVITMTLVMSR